MSPKDLYKELSSTGKSSICGHFDGVFGIYTLSDAYIYFHSSAERFRGARPSETEKAKSIDISNAMRIFPYSWCLELYPEDDNRISVKIPATNTAIKLIAKKEEIKSNMYIIRKIKYITVNQNY